MLPAASVSAGNVVLETPIVTGTAILSIYVFIRLWTDFAAQRHNHVRHGHNTSSKIGAVREVGQWPTHYAP